MTFEVKDIAGLQPVAAHVQTLLKTYPVACFYGQLGAGKTTFIKQLCVMLGVTDNISSPTYPIINEYSTLSGQPVFHMDLYRLDSEEAAVRIGLEEYLESGNICLIEWADNFESLLPEQHIKIFIRKLEDDIRSIDIRTSFP